MAPGGEAGELRHNWAMCNAVLGPTLGLLPLRDQFRTLQERAAGHIVWRAMPFPRQRAYLLAQSIVLMNVDRDKRANICAYRKTRSSSSSRSRSASRST